MLFRRLRDLVERGAHDAVGDRAGFADADQRQLARLGRNDGDRLVGAAIEACVGYRLLDRFSDRSRQLRQRRIFLPLGDQNEKVIEFLQLRLTCDLDVQASPSGREPRRDCIAWRYAIPSPAGSVCDGTGLAPIEAARTRMANERMTTTPQLEELRKAQARKRGGVDPAQVLDRAIY